MDGQTSIGPAESDPKVSNARGAAPGVDAQDANEFDMRRGLAGAEAKSFGSERDAQANPGLAKPDEQGEHDASASEPRADPNPTDPNERSDMIAERRSPGQHGSGGDPGWKPSR